MSLSPEAPVSRLYPVDQQARLMDLCGPHHRHLAILEQAFDDFEVRCESQGGGILIFGIADGVDRVERALQNLERRMTEGQTPDENALRGAIAEVDPEALAPIRSGASSNAGPARKASKKRVPGAFSSIPKTKNMRSIITAETRGQSDYIDALMGHSGLVFGVGPAGTGKTFLAVAAGVSELLSEKVERLIVARPAVEAGEKLGYLPGDADDKLDPYMMPIWDSLRELLGQKEIDSRRGRGEIEVAPLAFMRGRTLKNAFVVIDEAQNATVMQTKMLLTRLGRNSRMVVTGDPTQVDLPPSQSSGLAHAMRILRSVPGVEQCQLTGADVVRHELVGLIIDAYDSETKAG